MIMYNMCLIIYLFIDLFVLTNKEKTQLNLIGPQQK